MSNAGRVMTVVSGILCLTGAVSWALGLLVGGPFATGLGFLALFTVAGAALPILAVGGVLWAFGARGATSRASNPA